MTCTIATRGLIVGFLYYKDLRRTTNASALEALASVMLLLQLPFWRNAYFKERERALKEEERNRTSTLRHQVSQEPSRYVEIQRKEVNNLPSSQDDSERQRF